MRVLTDHDVRMLITADEAIAVMRQSLVDSHAGRLRSPARSTLDAGNQLTFTTGGESGGPAGFRVYGDWGPDSDQLTVAWRADGTLHGVVLGAWLGSARTGAIGAVGIDALSNAAAQTMGVLGSGSIAWAQLWASAKVRPGCEVIVHSRDRRRREEFARRCRDELGLDTRAVDTAESAVRGVDIIIVATRSTTPVFDAAWVSPGAHVLSCGPHTAAASELPSYLSSAAAVIVSDSPQQVDAEEGGAFASAPLTHLGAVLDGSAPGRRGTEQITLHLSSGLAGTEVRLAAHLLDL